MDLYGKVAVGCNELITKHYSTSFTLGIKALAKRFHDPIYAIYGYVRVADEIVDTFLEHDRATMLSEFRRDTVRALENGVSANPVIHAFQQVVREYHIEWELIEAFLNSMEMDLHADRYERAGYDQYIYGSAEVVGLMCLRVFVEGDAESYGKLKPAARSLGAAFQKVNFLRDLKADFEDLGRVYFPGVDFSQFTDQDKAKIEDEIDQDFADAYRGIVSLPEGARFGVYLAYVYYRRLFAKIRSVPAARIKDKRIRVSNPRKALILARTYLQNAVGVL